MKNLLLVLLGLATLGSMLALAWVLGTPAAPDPRVAQLEAEIKEARRTIATLKRDLEKRELPSLPPSPATPAPAAGPDAAPPPPAAAGRGGLRDMLANPQMRAVMDQQQAMQIEMSYARLFQHLGLNDQEKEHFKKLLTGRQKAMMDTSLKLMDPNLTPEQRQALSQEVEKQKTAFDQTIKAFLNNEDDWQTFQQWEATLPERQMFDTLGRGLFSSSAEPLSAQQEQQLIQLMAGVRASPGRGGNLMGKTNMDPAKMTPELINEMVSQLQVNAQVVEERAAQFLTPAQLQTLRAYHKQTIEMSKSGIEMSRMLMQGKGQ
ncbi:MAG TPA: hypothetical protein DIT64_00110 [Verrucomicrobiales bacterium]|nr:hypothetical protein [Verrucomicrobiales bacterium]